MGNQKKLQELDERLDELNYYQLLEVEAHWDYVSIQRKYQEYAPQYHPARYGLAQQKQRAERVTKRLHEASSVLSDPMLRPQYDQIYKSGTLRLDAEIRSSNVSRVREVGHPFARLYLHQARRKFESEAYDSAFLYIKLARSCFDCETLASWQNKIEAALAKSSVTHAA